MNLGAVSRICVDKDLSLRPISELDGEALFRLVDINRIYLRTWLPWLDYNQSSKDSEEFISRSMKQCQEGIGLVTTIEFNSSIVGLIAYNYLDQENSTCEIGYWISEEHQGFGIVTRSTKALVKYAFEILDLEVVKIPVAVENLQSRAVVERLGFNQQGIKHDAEWLYDHFVDHIQYQMTRIEWQHADK